jgi:hypothetical protein
MAFDTTIFINRDKIDFGFSGKILSFPLLPAFYRDLEIIDGEVFKTQFGSFLDKNGITIGTCAILLSEQVCFISEAIPKEKNIEEALGSFTSTLPFESPASRVLGNKVIGTNKDLYQEIMEIIGQREGRVKMISPIFLSKEMMGRKGLDEEMVKYASENENTLVKATFEYEAPILVNINANQEQQPQKRGKRELILIGAFAVLLIGFVIWFLIGRNAP